MHYISSFLQFVPVFRFFVACFMRFLVPIVLLAAVSACAQTSGKTIRICDDTGCSVRPRDSATFNPSTDTNPDQTRRLQALTELAQKDPRAAYDLGLRYFRGDGIEQNSHQAIEWMRHAAERGDLRAQGALGRFYLAGLEEMGSDPAEAEKWLAQAADRGDKEARQLLTQARAAKANEAEYRKWLDLHRAQWHGYWNSGYAYHWHWRADGWHVRY